jgi:hypothetical protein
MESLYGLLDRYISIEAVDLEEVQIRRVKARQGGIYSCEYGLAG